MGFIMTGCDVLVNGDIGHMNYLLLCMLLLTV